MIIVGMFTLFNCWGKCLGLCGAQRFAFDDDDADAEDDLSNTGRLVEAFTLLFFPTIVS